MKKIAIDRDKCIGCLTCVCACMVAHQEQDARNRVTIDSKNKPAPIFCMNCDKPECTYTCMTGAMSVNAENGRVAYDKDRCANCFMCIMACPYGVLKADSLQHKDIMKCDLCDGIGDSQPMCVKKCPMEAITMEVAV
ncbi:MAG: 4Fe-4S dicluster domain-containing protein [Treponema sp.]|nr:4Fe-4S dicluster domain-containing protein [Treponema sp.]